MNIYLYEIIKNLKKTKRAKKKKQLGKEAYIYSNECGQD